MYVTFDGQHLHVFPIRYEDNPTEIWTVDPSIFPGEVGLQKSFPSPRQPPNDNPTFPPVAGAPNRARHLTNIPSLGNTPFVGRDADLGRISS